MPDIAVGASGQDVGGNFEQGRVYIFSGRTGALLPVIDDPSPQPGAAFGITVTAAGDLRNGELLMLPGSGLDPGAANGNGLLFKLSVGYWVYHLSTTSLTAGQYTITLQMPDGQRYSAGFVLK